MVSSFSPSFSCFFFFDFSFTLSTAGFFSSGAGSLFPRLPAKTSNASLVACVLREVTVGAEDFTEVTVEAETASSADVFWGLVDSGFGEISDEARGCTGRAIGDAATFALGVFGGSSTTGFLAVSASSVGFDFSMEEAGQTKSFENSSMSSVSLIGCGFFSVIGNSGFPSLSKVGFNLYSGGIVSSRSPGFFSFLSMAFGSSTSTMELVSTSGSGSGIPSVSTRASRALSLIVTSSNFGFFSLGGAELLTDVAEWACKSSSLAAGSFGLTSFSPADGTVVQVKSDDKASARSSSVIVGCDSSTAIDGGAISSPLLSNNFLYSGGIVLSHLPNSSIFKDNIGSETSGPVYVGADGSFSSGLPSVSIKSSKAVSKSAFSAGLLSAVTGVGDARLCSLVSAVAAVKPAAVIVPAVPTATLEANGFLSVSAFASLVVANCVDLTF
uniref:Uncharacterized protein n=1 Tax=Micrurus surinamensis TaxID=129470 RepID=A0A2D4PKL2_MICSU